MAQYSQPKTHEQIVKDVINRHAAMVSRKSLHEARWQEIAEYILPEQAMITVKQLLEGANRTDRSYDSTGAVALTRYAAVIESMTTPREQLWHGLQPNDPRLRNDEECRQWCQHATDVLFALRYASRANFSSQSGETYVSHGAFGNGLMFIDEHESGGPRYVAIHVASFWIDTDPYGVVNTVHWTQEMSAENVLRRFKDDCPAKVKEMAQSDNASQRDQRVTIMHRVAPNDEKIAGATNYQGMPYKSIYICTTTQEFIQEGGFRKFPFAPARAYPTPGAIYATGAGSLCLPDIRQLNEMERTNLRAAQLAAEPPLLMPEDGLQPFKVRPSQFVYGGFDSQSGRKVVEPLLTGGNVSIGFEFAEQKRRIINEALLVTLFPILMEKPPQMTAFEVMVRNQDRGMILSPVTGRLQSEFLGNLIERELDIALRAGFIEKPPEKMMERGGVSVRYTAPINEAQRSEKAISIIRAVESLAIFENLQPGTLNQTLKVGESATQVMQMAGVPQELLYTKAESEQLKAGQQQAEQAQVGLDAAPAAAAAAKNMAEAAAITANMGQPGPMNFA